MLDPPVHQPCPNALPRRLSRRPRKPLNGVGPKHRAPPELQFVRSLGGSSWLATVDGATAVARVVAAPPSAAWVGMAGSAMARSAALVPILGWAEQNGHSWLLSEHVRAVSLDRLLTTVTLTPRQTAYLGRELLAAVGELHDVGLAHTGLSATSVLVGGAGAVHITDWAVRQASFDARTSAADATAVNRLLHDITRNAAARPQPGRRYDALLLSLLERCASQQGQALLAEAAVIDAALVAVGDTGAAAQARAGLQAVVTTLSRDAPAAGSRPPSLLDRRPRAPVDRLRPEPRPARRVRRATAIAATAAVVLGVGGYLAAHRLAAPRDPPAVPNAAAVAGAAHAPRPLPSMPATDGAVRGLDLRPLTTCVSGRSCELRVAAQVSPSAKPQQLAWSVRAVDRCGAATGRLASGALAVRAGSSYAYVTVRVRLPATHSLAVIASAGSPARAASSPLLVPASGGRC